VTQRGRIGIREKMAAFDQHVHGKDEVATGRGHHHGTVVTDACPNGRVTRSAAEEAVDEREFVHSTPEIVANTRDILIRNIVIPANAGIQRLFTNAAASARICA
jgi:hypothetical protein